MLDNQKIGKNILAMRKRRSLTQAELSHHLGVSHQAVSKWEHGECLPDIEVLLKLGRIFGKSVEEILLYESNVDDAPTAAITTSLWDRALEEIKKRLSKASFDTWFGDTNGELIDSVLCIYSPNNFTTEWLYSRYSTFIQSILDELTDESSLIVEFRSRDSNRQVPGLSSTNRARLTLQQTD